MNQVAKKLLLATVDVWDPLWIRLYRLRSGEKGPIPPFKNRDRIGARDIDWFLHSGRVDYQTLKSAITRWSTKPLGQLVVLDWGAGCGRILQHFIPDGVTMAASDVDPTAIQYLNKTFPHVQSIVNQSAPPLSFKSDAFDVIYAFSVWTHIPLNLQIEWLKEAHRLLKPGGIILISTMGYRGLKQLREGTNPLEADWHAITDDDLKARGTIYFEYPIFGQDDELFSGITGSYGIAIHDPDYIRRAWSGDFEVLEIVEGAFRDHQDLNVLRRV